MRICLLLATLALLPTITGCRRTRHDAVAATTPAAPAKRPSQAALAALARPHPRLWLTPERVANVVARARAGDRDWKAVEARARELLGFPVARFVREGMPARTIFYAYQGFGWLDAVVPLGLAYQVTGDRRYAAKLGDVLARVNETTAANDLSPISIDSGYPSRTAAVAVAIAYDWAHDALDPATRRATVATMNRWFDWTRANAFERDGPAYGNYFGGHLLGLAAMGYAAFGDDGRAPEIVAHTEQLFDAHVRPAFRDGGFAGGFPVEGYVYGGNHFVRLFQYLDLVRTATGRTPAELDDWAARCARNLLYNVKPDRWQVPDEASYAGDVTGVLADDLPRMLASVLGDRGDGPALRRLLVERGRPPAELPKDELAPALRLIHGLPTQTPNPTTTRPSVLHSPGDERIVVRSGWDEGAVWGSLNGGLSIWAGHQAKTAGHLAIQRGADYLLVYAGQWKGTSGLSGQPQLDLLTSDAANTLFVDDGGRYLTTGEAYRGGQGPFARTRPYAWAAARDFAWARLELADAYDRRADQRDARARTVKRYTRDFAWLAPSTFVVFDRAETARADDAKRVRFHFHHDGPPRVDGHDVTSVVGRSKLALRVLLPAEPDLATGWDVAKDTPLVPRVELGDRRANTRLDALTVVQALGRDEAPAAATLVRADGDALIGARVDAAFVLFAGRPDGVVPDVAIRYDVPTTPTRHLLLELPANRRYAVTRAGSRVTVAPAADGALTTDARGVLRFALDDATVRPLPPPDDGRAVNAAP